MVQPVLLLLNGIAVNRAPGHWLCVCVCVSGKDDVLDVEIDSYIHCISAFVKLAQSEYALLTEIIPEHHQKKTFDSLIQVSVCVRGRTVH